MIPLFKLQLRDLLRKIWVRVVGFAVLAVLAAALSVVLAPLLPETVALKTGADAVAQLLGILASSMLAVTTFSLSIAVSAFAAAANSATPRATILLQEDRTTQNVLATFLGAFLFGLVGLIALRAQFYTASGRVILFLFTVVVIALVVVALIRWIGHLMAFGRMDDTLDRVERAATSALCARLAHPCLDGQPMPDTLPDRCIEVLASETGHILHIDMAALQGCAEALQARLFVQGLSGAFVAPGVPLLLVEAETLDDDAADTLRAAFTISHRRDFENDPRFGLIVLTEIASRALSPAVNDPGTAIDILGRHVRILAHWRNVAPGDVLHDRVHVPALALADAIQDAFKPIARDGAPLFEVQFKLQKALSALCLSGPELFGPACTLMSREALARARESGLLAQELDRIRAAAPPAP